MMELTEFQKIFPAVCELKYNEPMSSHTSFRIGGGAEIMAFPKSREQLQALLLERQELLREQAEEVSCLSARP